MPIIPMICPCLCYRERPVSLYLIVKGSIDSQGLTSNLAEALSVNKVANMHGIFAINRGLAKN
nr:hypothetical protein [uncultured Methanomethylovorans sp.]